MSETEDWGPQDDIHDEKVTVVAGGLQQPIADLVAALAKSQIKSVRPIVGERENGYCASVLMLSIFVFESLVGRASHVRKLRTSIGRKFDKIERTSTSYVRVLDPTFPQTLINDLEEIYVLRDALAHGHMWTIGFTIRQHGTEYTSLKKHEGYGDEKYRAAVDEKTGRTRRLGLNALPSEIGLVEAGTALKKLGEAVEQLVKADALESAASERTIKYNGKNVKFWTLCIELERLWLEKPQAIAPLI